MPIILESPEAGHSVTRVASAKITIGLVNNMPDKAFEDTERQFVSLLDAAAGERLVALRLFALDTVPRQTETAARISKNYFGTRALRCAPPIGLIVTGAEPTTAQIEDEIYWDELASLIDWADGAAGFIIYSCLAAHAAAWRMDNVARRLLVEKRWGVFDHKVRQNHPLTKGMPANIPVPHSRMNGFDESGLREKGYEILIDSPDTGTHLAVKQKKKPIVLMQGHPEYEANSLFREYKREIRRHYKGTRPSYPAPPSGYFDRESTAQVEAYKETFSTLPVDSELPDFPDQAILSKLVADWRPVAVGFYRNWLDLIFSCENSRSIIRGISV